MSNLCHFEKCGTPATVLVEFDQGCVCFPNEKEQWLCEQHWYNSEPVGGGARVVLDLLDRRQT